MERAPVVAAVVALIFAGASFFFALAETALFSLGKWQARQLAERHPRLGGIVTRLLAEPQDLPALHWLPMAPNRKGGLAVAGPPTQIAFQTRQRWVALSFALKCRPV